jgi:hypothetical protein
MLSLLGYINKDGFITAKFNAETVPGEGNGFLNTGLAVACGLIEPPKDLITKCRVSDANPQIWRSPWKKNEDDEQENDDYWGALLLDKDWALDLYLWARLNNWFFDIHGKGRIRFWFGIHLHFPPFVKLCTETIELNWLDRAILFCSTILDAFSIADADGNKKAFCRISKIKKLGGACSWACQLWEKRVIARYGSIGGSWAASLEAGHPVSMLLRLQ